MSLLPNNIPLTITRTRRSRQLRIAVHETGVVKVTAPFWLGQKHIEEFIVAKTTWIVEKHRELTTARPPALRIQPSEVPALKRHALALITERINALLPHFPTQPSSIHVRRYRKRWGCCSRQGKLTFNIILAKVPVELVDYVIVHELCHLLEFNHSSKFYWRIAQVLPDYRKRRQQLREIRYSYL